MVVWARWTVDIRLDSSVVEHLTSNAGVPGSMPGPAIFSFVFLCICSIFVHSSNSYYKCILILCHFTCTVYFVHFRFIPSFKDTMMEI